MSQTTQALDKVIVKARALVAENKNLKKQLESVQDDRAIIKQLMSENSELQQKLNHYELVYGSKEEAVILDKDTVSKNKQHIKDWLNAALIEINGVTYVMYPDGFTNEESESFIKYFMKLSINGISIFEKPDDKHTVSNYSIAQICSFI